MKNERLRSEKNLEEICSPLFWSKFQDFGPRNSRFLRPAGWKENFNVRVTACHVQTEEGKLELFSAIHWRLMSQLVTRVVLMFSKVTQKWQEKVDNALLKSPAKPGKSQFLNCKYHFSLICMQSDQIRLSKSLFATEISIWKRRGERPEE